MPIIKFAVNRKNAELPNNVEKESSRNAVLPRITVNGASFLGWFLPENEDGIFMNYAKDDDVTLCAAITDEPAYIVQSHYRGDVNDYVGKLCHYRRYVVDVYIENAEASFGEFKLNVCNNFLYYLGHVPVKDIELAVNAPSRKFEGQYHNEADNFQTDSVSVKWKSAEPVNALSGRKKIARIMLYFSRWGIGYSEIAGHTSDETIMPDRSFGTAIGGEKAKISANFYMGVKDYETSSREDFDVFEQTEEEDDDGEVISRFAVMSDSHIGVRYNWGGYDRFYSAFDGIKARHEKKPLDFVVQIGDNIDDGYAETYKRDYVEYLDVIKRLDICDPVNPIENRAAGKIPHYEMQGNHDTSEDTRFFRNKMWYTEGESGERVYYIAFFAEYGGYPLVPYEITGDYDTYRSYGNISDETVEFVEKCMKKAKAENAVQIILLCHFGIAKNLFAPILPETGLGKLAHLCNKYGVKMYFNGHEHNADFSLYRFNGIYDYDAAMTADRYAIAEIKRKSAVVTVYNTEDNSVYRVDNLRL